MDKKIFETNVKFFKAHRNARRILAFVYQVLPAVIFVSYPALLIALFIVRGFSFELMRMVLIPLMTLIVVSVMRIVINEKRPYEVFGQPSVFNKKTSGKSMPSRHTSSAFVIAMVFLRVNITAGIAGLFIALLIELSRILAGAHFVRDVVVGAIIGIAAGLPLFLW